jgi:hypothetical protein
LIPAGREVDPQAEAALLGAERLVPPEVVLCHESHQYVPDLADPGAEALITIRITASQWFPCTADLGAQVAALVREHLAAAADAEKARAMGWDGT